MASSPPPAERPRQDEHVRPDQHDPPAGGPAPATRHQATGPPAGGAHEEPGQEAQEEHGHQLPQPGDAVHDVRAVEGHHQPGGDPTTGCSRRQPSQQVSATTATPNAERRQPGVKGGDAHRR